MSPWRQRRALITGGRGFIGSHLAREIAEQGGAVVVTTRGPLPTSPEGPRLRQVEPAQDWQRLLQEERPDVVFHLAGARPSRHADEDAALFEANVIGTLRCLEAAGRAAVGRIVIAGSAAEYGDEDGPWHEGLAARPLDTYGVTKATATHLAACFHRVRDLPTVVVRPFTVYGPGQPDDMFVAEAVRHAVRGRAFSMSEGTHRQDLVYVSDVVDGLLRAATVPGIEGSVINLGSGRARPLREIASLVWELCPTDAPLRVGARVLPAGPAHDACADLTRARRLLGWEPRVDLRTGLARTIEWARSCATEGDGAPRE